MAARDSRLRGMGMLDAPGRIQGYINSLAYNAADECNSPLLAMRKGRAHCFEGALLGAACLAYHGGRPLIVDLRAVNDDDHTIAVFRIDGLWGAVSKSNFTTLQYREPVYRSLRELAMSYFDFYFNTAGEKTLREYSRPLDLAGYGDWATTDDDLSYIGEDLDASRHHQLITGAAEKRLSRVEPRLLKAGLAGANHEGLYRPAKAPGRTRRAPSKP
jgi:hypothetical protein